MMEALDDQVELNSLIMTENKRSLLKRANDQFKAQISRIANYAPGQNGVAATSPAIEDDESGIVNRSPKTETTNNTHIPRSDGPWVALIALMLLLAAGWLFLYPPTKAVPVVPVTPVGPGSVEVPGGYQWQARPFDPFKQ